jgi:transcription elongation GreA/GreB family factor
VSKAFTREDGDLPEPPVIFEKASTLPPGAKNLCHANGARRLREKLQRLIEVDRPRIVAARDEIEAKQQLQLLDRRIDELQEDLQSAEIIPLVPVLLLLDARMGERVRFKFPSSEEKLEIVSIVYE